MNNINGSLAFGQDKSKFLRLKRSEGAKPEDVKIRILAGEEYLDNFKLNAKLEILLQHFRPEANENFLLSKRKNVLFFHKAPPKWAMAPKTQPICPEGVHAHPHWFVWPCVAHALAQSSRFTLLTQKTRFHPHI